ncbi:MAG: maleylacetoacetate isomerase [Alphaproteobacteria bacterium]|nr:maleylacetoacetate isomerase [Alphaproteobacteria bacterium]
MPKTLLHGYFRSSAAYRARIALNLKGIAYDQRSYHLRKGEQLGEALRAVNPAQLVPALETDGNLLTQSLAIIEYLEETHPQPALLPKDPAGRARVRAIALNVACEIHPLNNLRVLGYLEKTLGHDQQTRDRWYRHWVDTGFRAIEAMLAGSAATGRFCHGDQPGLADICLVPQVANAARVDTDMAPYPTIRRINAACQELPAFQKALPQNQPDAEP